MAGQNSFSARTSSSRRTASLACHLERSERPLPLLTCGIEIRIPFGWVRAGSRFARNDKFVFLILICALMSVGTLASGQSTGKTVRRHKVAVEDPLNPPELQQAEAAIEKKDYSSAEPLLKQVVAKNPANYRAWFDLGFVNNATGRTEESIAAYEKSVAAKPDVFESNLNLGLMLAKADQPDAEKYLRAATRLKPIDHAEQNQEQAWLALAHVLEASKPQDALDAYDHAAKLQPKDPEPHLSAATLLFRQNRFSAAEEQYRQVLAIDPKSADALIGV